MNIGIDIDGVLTNFERELVDYATKMSVDEGWPIDIDLSQYDELKAFKWNTDQTMKFWNKYILKYFEETAPRTFAPEVIEKLRNDGHKIILITATKYTCKIKKEQDFVLVPSSKDSQRITYTKYN